MRFDDGAQNVGIFGQVALRQRRHNAAERRPDFTDDNIVADDQLATNPLIFDEA